MTTRYSSLPGYITLMNGPGADHKFYVQRAPLLLRVVSDINGKWDVLDLLEDEPTREEEVHVYRQMGWVHVRANQRKDSGTYYDYSHIPIDGSLKASLRYNRSWRQWAEVRATELDRKAS